MKKIVAAIALAISTMFVFGGTPVEAGSSCYAPSVYRSGNYWTYTSYGTGNGYHRVATVKNGHWQYGPWKYGNGNSSVTVYYGSVGGGGTCFVYS